MKNLSLIWNAVLTLAVAFLLYKQYGSGSSSAPAAGSASAAGGSIMYVNTDSLLSNYDYFKDAQKELENRKYRLQVDLGNKERSLQGEAQALQQRAAAMSEAERQGAAVMFEKKRNELGQYAQQQQEALAQEGMKKNEELINSIQAYLKKVNASNKYQFVLGYTKGGGILFAEENRDITKTILEGLNKEYKDKKPAVATDKKDAPKK